MLTLTEKILFLAAVLASLYFTWKGVQRIIQQHLQRAWEGGLVAALEAHRGA